MKNPLLLLVAGVTGIIAIVAGVRQIQGAEAMPTRAEAAASAREATADLASWSNDGRGISLKLPRAWEKEEPSSGAMILKLKTFRGVVNLNVVSEDVADGTMLYEYVNSNVEQAMASLKEQQMAPEFAGSEKLVIGGDPGTEISMTYSIVEPKLDTQVTQAYVIHANRAFAITLTTPRELHAEYRALFRAIVESVKFAS
jgi:hypothetical protein